MADKSSEATSSESTSTQSTDERPSGNWWDSWISSAKSKSAEVYTMVKKDLDEIGTAVKSEASHVLNTTSNVIGKTFKLDVPESPANVMKKSFSTFIGQVSTVLNPEPDDEDDTEVILSSGDTTMLSTYKKELESLQRVDATFLVPAEGPEHAAWASSLERAPSALAERRLAASAVLREQYAKLVPDAVSHEDFWERYMFRVALLQDRLAAAARRQPEPVSADPVMAHLPLCDPILQSPKKVLSGIESDTEKSNDNSQIDNDIDCSEIDNVVVGWDDEEFANDVELTEEQQTLLLEEYEREIASKKTKQTSSRDITNNNTNKQTNTDSVKSKTKAAQTRDKQNNKKTDNKKNEKIRSPKKEIKDVCGNNLVEDYFGDEKVKDDASANSDESWEKEFEIEDVEQKA